MPALWGRRGDRVAAFAASPTAAAFAVASPVTGAAIFPPTTAATCTASRRTSPTTATATSLRARPVWLTGGTPLGATACHGRSGPRPSRAAGVSPSPPSFSPGWLPPPTGCGGIGSGGGAAAVAPSMAFEALTQEMDQTVRKLRGTDGVVTEAAIGGALEEVRRAMLAADVEPGVASQLLADVRERVVGGGAVVAAAGAEPAARFVSILVEELSAVMGKDAALSACLANTLAPAAVAAKRPSSSPTTAILDNLDAGRPGWLPDAAPAWMAEIIVFLRTRPWLQLLIAFPLYALHVLYFSTGGWKLPSTAIPNGKGLFSNVGFDTAAGAVVALGTLLVRKFLLRLPRALPPLLSTDTPPWKVSRSDKRKIANTTVLLVVAYLASGYGAVLIEQVLFLLAGLGVPLTIATTRAWKVLLGHLIWVFAGVKILRSKLNPFFPRRGSWMSWKWRTNWLAWAIGGYYVSAMLFNGADVVNHWLLPASLFNEDTVVSKLINPENRDVMAMAVGCVGPCITAPVFEEVLYRGFLLPALACYLPMWAAIPVSSVLFAVHHLNLQGVLPLSVLGFIWAILYTKSNNLAVTIIIHAMWNSRVFLSSFLGLRSFTDFE